MKLHAVDWATVLAFVAAFAAQVTVPQLNILFPGRGEYIGTLLSVAGIAAGGILRVYNNKTGAPAQTALSLTVPPSGNVPVIDSDGAHTASVVTTTSTKAFVAPMKGNP
jgi:hypothetical protein